MEWIFFCLLRLHRQKLFQKLSTVNNVTSRYLSLAYKVHGPSPPVGSVPIMVLHGLLGSKMNWNSMCNSITVHTGRSVIAVDARNHGDSPHSASHTYPELASDVSDLLSSLGVKKAVVIGHSMGGRTGMLLALTQRPKVASLVVVDISPITTASILNDFFPKLIDVMQSVDFTGAENINKARAKAKDALLKSDLGSDMEGMDFLLLNVKQNSNGTFGWKCNLDALKRNFSNIASFPEVQRKKYYGPTLFIGGSLSSYIPRDDFPHIQQIFPNAKLNYIEGAGHNVHAEAPNDFFNMFKEFLTFTEQALHNSNT